MNSITSLIVAAGSFLADRKIKEYVDRNFEVGEKKPLAGGKVTIEKAVNRGFAMNKLEDREKVVLTVSQIVFAIVLMTYAGVLIRPSARSLRFGYALLVGGAAGNVYDRWKKEYVVDYIHLSALKKIIFNLADVLIVAGVLITALRLPE